MRDYYINSGTWKPERFVKVRVFQSLLVLVEEVMKPEVVLGRDEGKRSWESFLTLPELHQSSGDNVMICH
jgi:hypothetical protein